MMEVMGGIPGHEKGVNDFFTVAELRCRLLSQLCAEENDDTATRVLAGRVFEQWLKNGIQQAGGNITYRDLMKLLFNYIFYEFVPNPAAKFDDVTALPATGPSFNSIVGAVKANLKSAVAILSGFPSPTAANSLVTSIQTSRDELAAIKPNSSKLSQIIGFLNSAMTTLATADEATVNGSSTVPLSSSFKDALANVNKALASLQGATATGTGVSFMAQRLRSQIIRPDCWFASPPACNVIFPEMYSQISYDRNFLSETTRLSVAVFLTLIGRASLLADYTLAPASSLSAQALAKYKGESAYRVLMDHELHVGIIPRIEWVPDTGATGAPTNPAILKTVKADRVAWTVRAGRFHFFK
jgi:hypothetical protein